MSVVSPEANQTKGFLYDDVGSINATYDIDNNIIYDKLVQGLFCVLYTIIFVLGLFGNALVCYVVCRNRAMQTVTNLFITNLALSDILLCIFAVPFTPLYTFLGRWTFGQLLCHIMPYAQGCSVYISTLTLTSIAIDRFFVIIYPFHPRMKLTTCVWIIFFIWTFSVVVTFPYGFYMEVQGETEDLCEEAWPSEKTRKTFGALTAIMQFILPFLIIAFCYICVSHKLNDRARSRPGSKNTRKEEAERDRKRRTNRMLIAMVSIFGMSWLPLNLINIFYDFYIPTGHWKYYFLVFFISHLIAMSSTCYNPFLYAWLNENFRKEFKQVLPCFDPSGGRDSFRSGRMGTYMSEKTCNGNNETIQETLLPSVVQRTSSIRIRIEEGSNEAEVTKDAIEVENILVATLDGVSEGSLGASYNSQAESIKLHLISEESLNKLELQR